MPSGGAVGEAAVGVEEGVTEEAVRVGGPVTAGEGPAMVEGEDDPEAE
jgi:hypothetical protein